MVLFVGKEPVVCKISDNASKTTEAITKQTERWLSQFKPDVVVTEKMTPESRKHGRTRSLIEAVGEIVQQSPAQHIEVVRTYEHQNIHEEAKTLCERYPQLEPWLPHKRPIWQAEHRNMAVFEAVSLVVRSI